MNRLFKRLTDNSQRANIFPKPLTVYEKRKTQKIGRLLEINGKPFYFKRLTDYHQRATYYLSSNRLCLTEITQDGKATGT